MRYRLKLVHLRTSAKAQVKAVLIRLGLRWPVNDLRGPGGEHYFDHISLPDAYRLRVESLRDLVRVFNEEIAEVQAAALSRVKDDAGYRTIQVIPGVGPVLGTVFVAEIGDGRRYGRITEAAR